MKACNDCPFKTASPLVGSEDWLRDVFVRSKENLFFEHSCHKTDKNADGYVGGEATECRGHVQMMMNEMDGTPGVGGVYNDLRHLVETYLRHWLGDEQFEAMAEVAKLGRNGLT